MADSRDNPWPTMLVLGVLCGFALGALAFLLLRKDKSGTQGALPTGGLDDDDLELQTMLLPKPRPQVAARRRPRATALVPARIRPVARTVMVSSAEPTMILQAVGERDWRVTARVVGPPGSSATFSLSTNPGDAMELPASIVPQEIRVPRGEFLYARGNQPNVQVSVAGGP